MNAYTRPRPQMPTATDYERAHRAIMDEVDRLNAAWRKQPREWRRIDDEQFDVEREAEQQGITVRRYLRGL